MAILLFAALKLCLKMTKLQVFLYNFITIKNSQ